MLFDYKKLTPLYWVKKPT